MKPDRLWKYYTLKFKRLRGNPHALALGFAIGVFIGITPTIPLHTMLIIVLTLLTRSSVIAGVLSSWLVCNPLTMVPIYYLELMVGNGVTPYHINWTKIKTVLEMLLGSESLTEVMTIITSLGYEVTVVMMSGGVIIGLPISIISYFLSLKFFVAYEKKRASKHILY